jgi:flagellin
VDRTVLDAEFQDVLTEIDREASVAGLDTAQGFSVFVSSNGTNGIIGGSIGAADTTTLGINALSIDSDTNAQAAVTAITAAVSTLGESQATVGTIENRLQFAMSLAQSQIVSNTAAESRIRDANIAEESANLTRFSILTQSGIAALAQANSQSGAVLSLLR